MEAASRCTLKGNGDLRLGAQRRWTRAFDVNSYSHLRTPAMLGDLAWSGYDEQSRLTPHVGNPALRVGRTHPITYLCLGDAPTPTTHQLREEPSILWWFLLTGIPSGLIWLVLDAAVRDSSWESGTLGCPVFRGVRHCLHGECSFRRRNVRARSIQAPGHHSHGPRGLLVGQEGLRRLARPHCRRSPRG